MIEELGYSAILFHSFKTREQVEAMQVSSLFTVDTRYSGFNATHSEIIDDLLIDKMFNGLDQYDVLLFVDHDFWLPDECFLAMAQLMIQTVACGKSLVARNAHKKREDNNSIKYFFTYPMFAVSAKFQWPEKWHYVTKPYGFRDTGQLLYEKMKELGQLNEIELINDKDVYFNGGWHWSSAWDWLMYIPYDPARHRKFSEHYAKLMQCGVWTAGLEDQPKIYAQPMLGPIARANMTWK